MPLDASLSIAPESLRWFSLRMKIGICTSPREAANLPPDAFDFVEVNVQTFLAPEEDEEKFEASLEEARACGNPVSAANCFLPARLKCVGPEMDLPALMKYAETALARARRAGIGIIVFGSGAARLVPEGYPDAAADFTSLLKRLGPIAAENAVKIVVEPLNPGETNLILSLEEGARIVEECDHPNIRLLADLYHMALVDDGPEEIVRAGHLLEHVHVAEKQGRARPGKHGEDFGGYLRALREIGYEGSISLECQFEDLAAELAPGVAYLRGQLRAAGLE